MSDFCASLWPEEPTPEHLKNCSECGLYKHGSRMIGVKETLMRQL